MRISDWSSDVCSSDLDVIEIGDYAFVHAGVCPGVDLADQRAADLRWIRNRFLRHEGDFGKLIIHGHTITDAPEDLPNRIGIDTGAFASGRLPALGLEGEARWFLASSEERRVGQGGVSTFKNRSVAE